MYKIIHFLIGLAKSSFGQIIYCPLTSTDSQFERPKKKKKKKKKLLFKYVPLRV